MVVCPNLFDKHVVRFAKSARFCHNLLQPLGTIMAIFKINKDYLDDIKMQVYRNYVIYRKPGVLKIKIRNCRNDNVPPVNLGFEATQAREIFQPGNKDFGDKGIQNFANISSCNCIQCNSRPEKERIENYFQRFKKI